MSEGEPINLQEVRETRLEDAERRKRAQKARKAGEFLGMFVGDMRVIATDLKEIFISSPRNDSEPLQFPPRSRQDQSD